MMQERVLSAKPRRVALDSVSVFLQKVQDAFVDREKMFQLASIVQNSQAVGQLSPRLGSQTTYAKVLATQRPLLFSLLAESELQDELRQLLYGLVNSFKALGVTALLTLESRSLQSTEGLTDHGLSPVADNLILLRYEQLPEALRPSIVVVKTRGSSHDWGRYAIEIGRSGMRIGAHLATTTAPAAPSRSRAKR